MGNGASSWSCRQSLAALEESEQEFLQAMDKERREGKALLRKMVVKSDDIDWEAVIEQAQFLHKREQQRLQRRENRWKRRQRQQALGRRKKYDAVGSFSVNLLVMTTSQSEDVDSIRRWRSRTRSDVTTRSVLTISNSTSSLDEEDMATGYNTTLIRPECWNVEEVMEAEI